MQPSTAPLDPTLRPRKPEGVTGAVWIVIILSAFMAWSGAALLVAQGLTEKIQSMQAQMVRPGGHTPPAEVERMMELQRAMMAAARPDFAAPAGALGLLVAIAGIVCAVRLNKRRRDSATWFSYVTIAIVALEVISVVQGLQVQRRMQPLMAQFMASIPQLGPSERAAPVLNMMNSAMSGVSAMTLIFTVGWGLAKIVACLYARYAASKPAVRAWLAD